MPSESAIWQIGLFQKTSSTECQCLDCKKPIKMTKQSTTGPITHLRSVHKGSEYEQKFNELQKRKEGEKGSMDKHISLTMSGSGGISSYDKKIINWIARTQTSFSAINDPTTHALFNGSNPLHHLKDESHYRKNILPKVYELVRAKVKSEIEEWPKIAFTTDIWSDGPNCFISLTAHGISKNFQHKHFVLSIAEFEGSHTGELIAEKLRQLLDSFTIPKEKCGIFVRDGAANYGKAFTEKFNPEGWKNTICAAHLLNLVVQNALNVSNSIKALLAKGRKIVGHYKHSPLAQSILAKIQKEFDLPLHRLIQDVPTRWNASYSMLKRLSEQEQALDKYAVDQKKFDMAFTEEESKILKELIRILEPMDELTRLFCLPNAPISIKFPFAKMAERNLSRMQLENLEVKKVQSELVTGLQRRFDEFNIDESHILAQFLDPRIKCKFSISPELLRNDVLSWLGPNVAEVEHDLLNDDFLEISSPIKSPPAKKPCGLISFFNDTLGTNENIVAGPQKADLATEITRYCSLANTSVESEPLEFWKENAKEFPRLSEEAKKLLCAPATSVATCK